MIEALMLLVAAAGAFLLVAFVVGHLTLWCLTARHIRKRARRLTKAGFHVGITYRPNAITLRTEHPVTGRVRAVRQAVDVFS
jgi:phosphoglycerate-specific signal transduction histidine kinase